MIPIAEIPVPGSAEYFKAEYKPAKNAITGVPYPKNKNDIPMAASVKTNNDVSDVKINCKESEEILYINAIAKLTIDRIKSNLVGSLCMFLSRIRTLKAFQSFPQVLL